MITKSLLLIVWSNKINFLSCTTSNLSSKVGIIGAIHLEMHNFANQVETIAF